MSLKQETTTSVSKLAQPYHFAIKTYAKGTFSIDLSIHLAEEEIDNILTEDGPIVQGLKNLKKLYQDEGFTYLTEAVEK